ncbi:MAG: hypothetical protein KAU01_00305, partial [Candidatus Cloacimonetes bacterium]|nr:hypothetical protein [Candidatus Cloacimonadota bacterium]
MKKQLRIIFIVIGMILIPLITNAQVPMTDTFNGATLNTGIWEFVDPVDDCSVILNNGNAEISIPAGTSHDLHFDLAPRLLQTISNEDFTVQIKFDSAPAAQYQMQGFIVQTTNNAARLRFETYFGSQPYFYVNTYGVSVTGLPINQAIGGAIPQYLKLDRAVNEWTFDYSYDGTLWYNVSTYTLDIIVEKIGFYGANHTPNPAFTAMTDYFWNLDQPLPVTLSSFTAIYANSTPILHWTTQSENSNLGWNVYRSFSQNLGQASQINNELIPGAGTTSEPTDYQFTDEYDAIVGQTYWYWLESISDAGETESYGPVS